MLPFLLISFIAGLLTVLAPCILPLLPVIVGGSIGQTQNTNARASALHALVIVLSLGASVFLFTLILKASTAFISIPALAWQIVAGVLLIFFGFITLVPRVWDSIPVINLLYRNSNRLIGEGYKQQNLWGDIIMGAALGPVFSSCSPTYFVILAAVLPAHFGAGLLYLLAYVLGLCLFLFAVAFLGQKTVKLLGVASDPNSLFKKIIGIIFILVGIAVIFGIDKKIEAALPAGAFGEVNFEQYLLSLGQQNPLSQTSGQKAPELQGIDGYINTNGEPITLASFQGKDVVLIDFWDYSCINCQRTIPYLNAWYQKYKDEGLVIIGVHTPEFAFEHSLANVEQAVRQFGIQYPVVLDNEYATWNAYQNDVWPREYLINIDGNVIYNHEGEGNYGETEAAIQQALRERMQKLGMPGTVQSSTVNIQPQDLSAIQSPETYFGAARNEYLGNGAQGRVGQQQFTFPNSVQQNTLYFNGRWNIADEYAEASQGAAFEFKYNARDVYMVATADSPVKIKILRDGVPVGSFAGADVNPTTSEATIQGDRLYKLIHDDNPGTHTIEVQIESGTLQVYTLTFG